MKPEEYSRKLDEFKELGLEYRYKDQMMVQELGFTLIVLGVVASSLVGKSLTGWHVCLQVIVGIFLVILYGHLSHTNADRKAVLDRKEALREELNFTSTHQGVGGKRLSAPRTMVWFAALLVALWWAWVVWTIVGFLVDRAC